MPSVCSSCGFNNPPGMRFCGNCGTRLELALQSSAPIPEISQLPQKVGAMMGADLFERFRAAGLEAAGQNRNVTILFVDLCGFTRISQQLDNEDLYEMIQQFIELLANDVYKYEGMVDKFTGDGLMALFGAPIAHENNAELGIRAALDMRADVADLNLKLKDRLGCELQVHIGLNDGSVIVGGIGSNLLMNYTAIGDTVNLAQRLEEAASPGTILVSESVYHKTKMLFDYDVAPTLQLKGVVQPIRGFQVIGSKARPGLVRGLEGLYSPMVGRERELVSLENDFYELVEARRGRFVMIAGEAGIGKSRLIRELKTLLDQSKVHLWEGQSLTYRRFVSYWIFQDALRNFLGVTPDTPENQLRERLVHSTTLLLGKRGADLLPYLEHLLSISPSDSAAAERIRYLEASQLRQQVFVSVRELLLAVARQKPLVFILEDLHWADQASLDLLQFLLESTRIDQILIIGISRPYHEEKIKHLVNWSQQHLGNHFHEIRLKSLSLNESERLLFQLLDNPDMLPQLRDQILNRAAGVPFYLEEILRMLIDHGVIQRKGQNWRLSTGHDLSKIGVPETLEGLVLARFDRLDETSRHVLQVASVIGKDFNVAVLNAVLPNLRLEDLKVLLSQLSEREFILPQSESPYTEYTFRHVLMSDAIYKTLLRKDRMELHGEIGSAIEVVYAHRLEGQIEILARHYGWSNRYDRALHYLILAGQRSERNFDNEQARQQYEQALELLGKVEHMPSQAVQVFTGLGDVSVFMGEYPTGREYYQQAMQIACGNKMDKSIQEQSSLKRKISVTYERQGDYDQALQYLSDASQILDESHENFPIERAQIFNDIGWIHFRRGNVEDAEKNLSLALSLVEAHSRYDVIASIYNRLGGVFYTKEQLDQAATYVRKSLVLREELGDTVAVARSYNNLGLLAWRQGDLDRALEYFTRSVNLHATLGDIEGTIQLNTNIGLLLTDKGDLDQARQYLEKSLETSQQIGQRFVEGMSYHHLSRFWLAAREWEKALEYSKSAEKVFNEIGTDENIVDLHASMGEAWLGLENLEEARRSAETAWQLLEVQTKGQDEPSPVKGRVLRLMGSLATRQKQWDTAAHYLKESSAQFSELGNQLEFGRTLIALAVLAREKNDRIAFRLQLNEARLIFRQLGAQLDLNMVEELLSV